MLAACDASDAETEASLRIYLLHVGESDRGLPAFALVDAAPGEDELARHLGEPEWRSASVLLLPTASLARATALIERHAVSDPPEFAGAFGLGAYRAVLLRGSDERALHLAPDATRALLRELRAELGERHPDLERNLAGLATRLG